MNIPYMTTQARPLLRHRNITIYHVGKDYDEIGYAYQYTTGADQFNHDELAFDIRNLPNPDNVDLSNPHTHEDFLRAAIDAGLIGESETCLVCEEATAPRPEQRYTITITCHAETEQTPRTYSVGGDVTHDRISGHELIEALLKLIESEETTWK